MAKYYTKSQEFFGFSSIYEVGKVCFKSFCETSVGFVKPNGIGVRLERKFNENFDTMHERQVSDAISSQIYICIYVS
jgi:hypothetical protein